MKGLGSRPRSKDHGLRVYMEAITSEADRRAVFRVAKDRMEERAGHRQLTGETRPVMRECLQAGLFAREDDLESRPTVMDGTNPEWIARYEALHAARLQVEDDLGWSDTPALVGE